MAKKHNYSLSLYTWCWSILILAILPKETSVFQTNPHLPIGVSYSLFVVMGLLLAMLSVLIIDLKAAYRWVRVELVRGFWNIVIGLCVCSLLPISSIYVNRCLGVIMLSLLIALILVLWKTPSSSYTHIQMNKHKKGILLGSSLLALAIIGATVWKENMWGISLSEIHLEGDLLGYFSGQLSLTFITISVMSVLSDKSVIVYWENVAEAKLIQPLFGSFASYTYYSISTTVGAGISVIFKKQLAFAVFFAINIIILIFLTLTMVDVYYGRDEKKRSREKVLQNATALRTKKAKSAGQSLPIEEAERILSGAEEYDNIMFKLQHYLHQEIEAYNIPYIREVAEMYGRNMHCFCYPEGREVEALLISAPAEVWSLVLDGIDFRTTELEQLYESPRLIISNGLNKDWEMWKALSENKHLDKAIKDIAIRNKLLDIVLHRLALMQRDMLLQFHYYKFYRIAAYTQITLGDGVTRRFSQFDFVPELQDAFERGKKNILTKEGLLSSLVALLLILLKTDNKEIRAIILQQPLVKMLTTDMLQFLGLDEKKIADWEHYRCL